VLGDVPGQQGSMGAFDPLTGCRQASRRIGALCRDQQGFVRLQGLQILLGQVDTGQRLSLGTSRLDHCHALHHHLGNGHGDGQGCQGCNQKELGPKAKGFDEGEEGHCLQ
jgi:hypothetical protein